LINPLNNKWIDHMRNQSDQTPN